MDGFIFFIIFVFVVIPIIKNIVSGGKKKPKGKNNPPPARRTSQTSQQRTAQQNSKQVWGQSHRQIQEKIVALAEKKARSIRDAHGHSNARQNTRDKLSRNVQSQSFPENHASRVLQRNQRDKNARKHIEASIHSRNNRAITRVNNKGVDGWGVRGDKGNFGGLIFWIVVIVIGALVYTNFEPQIRDLLNF